MRGASSCILSMRSTSRATTTVRSRLTAARGRERQSFCCTALAASRTQIPRPASSSPPYEGSRGDAESATWIGSTALLPRCPRSAHQAFT